MRGDAKVTRYNLRFWFEHGGFCVWGMNDAAKRRFGYPIPNNKLPISASLIKELDSLEDEYGTYLDWAVPQNPSTWSNEQKKDFMLRATKAYQRLQYELGGDFVISNEVHESLV